MVSLPLFKPIPIRIKVTCRSKPLPLSAANDPKSFEFPRNPKVTDIDFTLRTRLRLSYRRGLTSVTRVIEDDMGLQAGFGLPNNVGERDTWGKNIEVVISPPTWSIDKEDPKKGFWSEDVTFSSLLYLRCPPPIHLMNLSTAVRLIISCVKELYEQIWDLVDISSTGHRLPRSRKQNQSQNHGSTFELWPSSSGTATSSHP